MTYYFSSSLAKNLVAFETISSCCIKDYDLNCIIITYTNDTETKVQFRNATARDNDYHEFVERFIEFKSK